MNKLMIAAFAVGLGSLTACQQSPEEAQAENIEANVDNAADAFEAAAENAVNESEEAVLENVADELRETGDNMADNVVENAAN